MKPGRHRSNMLYERKIEEANQDMLYQRKIEEANQAREAWKKQDNHDTENMRICAFALLRAADYAFTNSSRIECLREAKEILEELLKIDSCNHDAKYKLGTACYRLWRQESVTDKDREKLCLKAINCFKEAYTKLPAYCGRMLHCMSERCTPDQRLFYKLPDCNKADGPMFDIESRPILGYIRAYREVYIEWFYDPENPRLLMRYGIALMELAKYQEEYRRQDSIKDASKKFEAGYSTTKDYAARLKYLKAYLAIIPPKRDELYARLHKEYHELEGAMNRSTRSGGVIRPIDEDKPSDLEPTDSPVFDIECSVVYGHIQALKDAERESVEDPENPQVLKRLVTAFMGIARFIKDQDKKEMFFADAFKAVSQLSGIEPTDSPVFDIERSVVYEHIQALKDAERESVEDPENPQVLKRLGTALLKIARSVKDGDEKKMFLAGALKNFDAVYSKTNDKEARYEYMKAYLEITPQKGYEDVHYHQLAKEFYDYRKY